MVGIVSLLGQVPMSVTPAGYCPKNEGKTLLPNLDYRNIKLYDTVVWKYETHNLQSQMHFS